MSATHEAGAQAFSRRPPVGAELRPEGGVHFRVWAPDRKQVKVILEQDEQHAPYVPDSHALSAEEAGYFSVFVPEVGAGTLYRYCLS